MTLFSVSLDIRQGKNGFEFEILILFSRFYFEKMGKFCYVLFIFYVFPLALATELQAEPYL